MEQENPVVGRVEEKMPCGHGLFSLAYKCGECFAALQSRLAAETTRANDAERKAVDWEGDKTRVLLVEANRALAARATAAEGALRDMVELCDHADVNAWKNDVTDAYGSMDEGVTRALTIIGKAREILRALAPPDATKQDSPGGVSKGPPDATKHDAGEGRPTRGEIDRAIAGLLRRGGIEEINAALAVYQREKAANDTTPPPREPPATCPTCFSTDPAVRKTVGEVTHVEPGMPCFDKTFHDAPRAEGQRESSADGGEGGAC